MQKQIIISNSVAQTKRCAQKMAQDLLARSYAGTHARIVALEGNLGAGKTTFAQGFAKGLGIKEKILSPTFVILKKFEIRSTKSETNTKYKILNTKYLYHIDVYRLQNPKELLALGWKEIIANPKNIVLVEWADRVKKILPKGALWVCFKATGKAQRKLRIVGARGSLLDAK